MKMQCKTCGHVMGVAELGGYLVGRWLMMVERWLTTRGLFWDILNKGMAGFANSYRVVCPVCDKPGIWGSVDEGTGSIKKDC